MKERTTSLRPRARSGVVDALGFAWAHPVPVAGATLLTAGARFLQAGWSDALPTGASLALELVVLAGRVGLVLIALGEGHLGRGIQAVRGALAQPERAGEAWVARLVEQARRRWRPLAGDAAALLVIVVLLNGLIDDLAGFAPVLAWVSALVDTREAAPSATVLLLKNGTVIPLVILVQVRVVMLLAGAARPVAGAGA